MNVSKVLNKMFDLVFIRRVKTVEAPCEPWWEEEKRRTREAIVYYIKEVASAAQLAYEADLKVHPFYACDGTPRKIWDQLCETERRAWDKPVQEPPYNHNIGSFGGRSKRHSDDDDDDCLGTGYLFDCMMGM